MKANDGNKIDADVVKAKIVQLKIKIIGRKNPIQAMFSRVKNQSNPKLDEEPDVTEVANIISAGMTTAQPEPEIVDMTNDSTGNTPTISKKKCPRQSEVTKELLDISGKMKSLKKAKMAGVPFTKEMKKNLDTFTKVKSTLQKGLKKLKRQQKYSATNRSKVREIIKNLRSNPDLAGHVSGFRETPGNPRLEDKQPELLKTIVAIVTRTAAAEPRRRTEALHSCRTLDELHAELLKLGKILIVYVR
jgi:hypothetical protein